MNESQFRDRIKELIPIHYFKIHGNMMQKSGWPDVYVYSRIWTGWLELKVGSNKADPLQVQCIKALKMQHVPAFVLRGLTKRAAILEDENGNTISPIVLLDGPGLLQQLARTSRMP